MCDFWWLLSLLGCFWCLYTPSVFDQRLLLVYFLSFVLVIHLFVVCFGISALGIFYLSALLGYCLWVVTGSEGCRVIYFFHISFISKNTKIFFLLHTYASLSFCIGTVLALGLLVELYLYFHIGMITLTFEGKILHLM